MPSNGASRGTLLQSPSSLCFFPALYGRGCRRQAVGGVDRPWVPSAGRGGRPQAVGAVSRPWASRGWCKQVVGGVNN